MSLLCLKCFVGNRREMLSNHRGCGCGCEDVKTHYFVLYLYYTNNNKNLYRILKILVS